VVDLFVNPSRIEESECASLNSSTDLWSNLLLVPLYSDVTLVHAQVDGVVLSTRRLHKAILHKLPPMRTGGAPCDAHTWTVYRPSPASLEIALRWAYGWHLQREELHCLFSPSDVLEVLADLYEWGCTQVVLSLWRVIESQRTCGFPTAEERARGLALASELAMELRPSLKDLEPACAKLLGPKQLERTTSLLRIRAERLDGHHQRNPLAEGSVTSKLERLAEKAMTALGAEKLGSDPVTTNLPPP
jgi:hypothetical protein